MAANNVLDTPLSSPEGSEPVKYVRQQAFSNPGVAGMRRFGNACSDCHGERGGGTDRGPSLLNKDYARDFRNSEVFHSAVGQAIAAHRDLLADLELEGKEGFNNLEFMGKFLREARRQELVEQSQRDRF
ncbi:MAG: hypothetical protein AAGH68_05300 [Pseudomonadota bacterium]